MTGKIRQFVNGCGDLYEAILQLRNLRGEEAVNALRWRDATKDTGHEQKLWRTSVAHVQAAIDEHTDLVRSIVDDATRDASDPALLVDVVEALDFSHERFGAVWSWHRRKIQGMASAYGEARSRSEDQPPVIDASKFPRTQRKLAEALNESEGRVTFDDYQKTMKWSENGLTRNASSLIARFNATAERVGEPVRLRRQDNSFVAAIAANVKK